MRWMNESVNQSIHQSIPTFYCKEPEGISSPGRSASLSPLQVTKWAGSFQQACPSPIQQWVAVLCGSLVTNHSPGGSCFPSFYLCFAFRWERKCFIKKSHSDRFFSLPLFPQLLNTFLGSHVHRREQSRLPWALPWVSFLPMRTWSQQPTGLCGSETRALQLPPKNQNHFNNETMCLRFCSVLSLAWSHLIYRVDLPNVRDSWRWNVWGFSGSFWWSPRKLGRSLGLPPRERKPPGLENSVGSFLCPLLSQPCQVEPFAYPCPIHRSSRKHSTWKHLSWGSGVGGGLETIDHFK